MNPSPTPEKIMQLGMAFWGSKTLLSAVELEVFTELARQPLNADTLQTRLGLHPRSARDFFDALVALGILERDNGLYKNTPETDLFLDKGKTSYIGGFLEMANARLYRFWGSLTEGLKTGLPQNEAKEGGDFFGTLYAKPYHRSSSSRYRPASSSIAHFDAYGAPPDRSAMVDLSDHVSVGGENERIGRNSACRSGCHEQRVSLPELRLVVTLW